MVLIVGTRPEAIKVAPVALAAAGGGGVRTTVVATGQHRELVDHALAAFGVAIDHRLELPARSGGSQAELFTALLPELDRVLGQLRPHAVLVQGDTASALAGALAATWHQVPLVHLEAGLRSFDRANPFPEESYRCLIGAVADLHLAPTPRAVGNLLAEGVPAHRIVCTGNTVVDAARFVAGRAPETAGPVEVAPVVGAAWWSPSTAERTGAIPSWPSAGRCVPWWLVSPTWRSCSRCTPTRWSAGRCSKRWRGWNASTSSIPWTTPRCSATWPEATLVLTDSGGIQEEAPTFGVPVLVLRETTERPEAIEAGCAALVGTDPQVDRGPRRRTPDSTRPPARPWPPWPTPTATGAAASDPSPPCAGCSAGGRRRSRGCRRIVSRWSPSGRAKRWPRPPAEQAPGAPPVRAPNGSALRTRPSSGGAG